MTKLIILILVGYYLPGYKAGGPIRSIANLVEALGDEFDFRVVTSDRDIQATVPYQGVIRNEWVTVGKAQVVYLPPWSGSLWKLLRTTQYDILYLNSFFARRFSVIPYLLRRTGLTSQVPVILAPRGEFSLGALRLKRWRKWLYLRLANSLGLYKDVIWHASSPCEAQDIIRAFNESQVFLTPSVPTSSSSRIFIAPDLQRSPSGQEKSESLVARQSKKAGRLRVVFLSRIARKKNLDGALTMLQKVAGNVQFEIYGPIEDRSYWKMCERLMRQLPTNIQARYCGVVNHDEVAQVFSTHDLFFFPTYGENYGHAIMESLSAGCPVLISDQVPWRNLEELGVGWDIPLNQPERFQSILQHCVNMDAAAHEALSKRARVYGKERACDPKAIEQNQQLFRYAASLGKKHVRG